MNVLVADDEERIRETIYDYFTFKGALVHLAKDGKEAVDMAYLNVYDVIILDIMMPVMNGIEACRQIRENQDVPVLFLTALGMEKDLYKGYESGADDYIVKPFPLAVLYKKCQIMYKRYKGTDNDNKISAAGILLDFGSRKVFVDGKEVNTTLKDFSLLALLIKNKGRVLDRDTILTRIWGFDYDGDTRVVDTHIKRIRKMLNDKGKYIVTKVNVGYMFEEK